MRTKEEYANWFRNSSTASILLALFVLFATISFMASVITGFDADSVSGLYLLYKTLYDPTIYVGIAVILILPIINLLFYGFNCIKHKNCPALPLIPYVSSFMLACLTVNAYTLVNNFIAQHITIMEGFDFDYGFVSSLPFTVIFLLYSAIFACSIFLIVIGFFMEQKKNEELKHE